MWVWPSGNSVNELAPSLNYLQQNNLNPFTSSSKQNMKEKKLQITLKLYKMVVQTTNPSNINNVNSFEQKIVLEPLTV